MEHRKANKKGNFCACPDGTLNYIYLTRVRVWNLLIRSSPTNHGEGLTEKAGSKRQAGRQARLARQGKARLAGGKGKARQAEQCPEPRIVGCDRVCERSVNSPFCPNPRHSQNVANGEYSARCLGKSTKLAGILQQDAGRVPCPPSVKQSFRFFASALGTRLAPDLGLRAATLASTPRERKRNRLNLRGASRTMLFRDFRAKKWADRKQRV